MVKLLSEGSMAEEYPVAPARMASLRDKDKNGSSDKEKKGRGWFGKNKGMCSSSSIAFVPYLFA